MAPEDASEVNVLVAIARLEGKVDVVLSRHDVRLENVEREVVDHEGRIRTVEARPEVPPAVDERLRAVEDRRTVSPRDLLITSGSIVALIAGVATLIDWLKPVLNP